jgi:serine/threonine-protein kinase
VLSRVLTDKPAPITMHRPELPPALAELVMNLLAKAPADRPGPARAVRDQLLAMVEQLTPPAEPEPPADALGATMQPGDAMAATADASAPPLAVTADSTPGLAATAAESAIAKPVDVRALAAHAHAVGATTGVAAGEVSLAPQPAKRRPWLVPLVAFGGLAITGAGWLAMRSPHDTTVVTDGAQRDATPSDTSLPDSTPDMQISDAGVIDAVIDASLGRLRPRKDAGAVNLTDGRRQIDSDGSYKPMELIDENSKP